MGEGVVPVTLESSSFLAGSVLVTLSPPSDDEETVGMVVGESESSTWWGSVSCGLTSSSLSSDDEMVSGRTVV